MICHSVVFSLTWPTSSFFAATRSSLEPDTDGDSIKVYDRPSCNWQYSNVSTDRFSQRNAI